MSRNSKYQLIIIGADNSNKNKIIATFFERINDLGLTNDIISLLDRDSFDNLWNDRSPTIGIYFGALKRGIEDLEILDRLIANSSYILPVVNNLNAFPQEVPESIRGINGIGMDRASVDDIVSVILEGFGLLRSSRRLFISYRRADSSGVAIQLYEELDSAGFDVFLDTHSIRPVVDFQEELWHRLVDTDVVLLVDTPGFRESKWTTAELNEAVSMSIGIYQLVWPEHLPKDDTGFCFTKLIKQDDFYGRSKANATSKLKKRTIKEIKHTVESLRARNLAVRQDLLIGNFAAIADASGRVYTLQPQRYITYFTKGGEEVVVIPTVGVPDAYGFHFCDGLVKRIHEDKIKQLFILYDKTNIKQAWQQHLHWLNNFLPVKSVSLNNLNTWINNN